MSHLFFFILYSLLRSVGTGRVTELQKTDNVFLTLFDSYAYVTMEDIKKVDSLQDSLVLAVSTPYETYMQFDDRSTDVRSTLRKKGDCIMRADLRLNLIPT